MGRRKLDLSPIGNEKEKKITMKKRRTGILKKAMQLSKLTDAHIHLKVFTPQDQFLLEYASKKNDPILKMDKSCPVVKSYAKYYNDDYNSSLKIQDQMDNLKNENNSRTESLSCSIQSKHETNIK